MRDQGAKTIILVYVLSFVTMAQIQTAETGCVLRTFLDYPKQCRHPLPFKEDTFEE